jgi:porphobilinogen synthase
MTVPFQRPRRLRDNAILRNAISETQVRAENLMLPMFVADIKEDREIQGMPGVHQRGIDSLTKEVASLVEAGVKSFILFGLPEGKDAKASHATRDDSVVSRAIRALKKEVGSAALICTDVCVCSYTDTGHCGIIRDERLDNDASIEVIADMALAHARAGADMVAPSDMMDGRVRRIREKLDAAGLPHTPIMSYSVKYASSLYGPFRHAADSAPKFGDRRGYQMDFRNARDARREAKLDVEEGADLVMVKPGLAYLDILRDLSQLVDIPLAAYQVSGEYSMIKYAAQANAIDEAAVVRELWHSFRRAGASLILTYHAGEALRRGWLERA